MKHAFLIMAHGSLPLLRVLLSMLDDERNDIFLHIDRKSDMLDGAEPQVFPRHDSLYWNRGWMCVGEI